MYDKSLKILIQIIVHVFLFDILYWKVALQIESAEEYVQFRLFKVKLFIIVFTYGFEEFFK